MAWLSWQEGRLQDVVVMAEQAAALFRLPAQGFGPFQWIYLFPLVAAQLAAGRPAEAVAAARQVLDVSQQRLPDELESALASAGAGLGPGGDRGGQGQAGPRAETGERARLLLIS